MDLSHSPFWIESQQHTLIFDFTNASNERCNEDNAEEETSDDLIGRAI